jgi:peptidoglycan hydrolase CwlO-like protein
VDPNQIIVNVLVVVASGSTSVLVAVVLKRLTDIGNDVKEIRGKVDDHAERLAESKARIEQLRVDVDGLMERERERAA